MGLVEGHEGSPLVRAPDGGRRARDDREPVAGMALTDGIRRWRRVQHLEGQLADGAEQPEPRFAGRRRRGQQASLHQPLHRL